MQTPEVYNFPAPDSYFSVEKFKGFVPLTNPNINSFHYNHLVTVITPDPQNFPENFFTPFQETGIFYKISDLKPEDFADVKFLSSFIRNGKLTLLSINKRIDCDNCIGITPDSKLYISLDKETYQSFGIEGTTSHFTKQLQNRYFVSIDLANKNLLSNKSKLQRLKSCLKVLKKFTVIVTWDPPDKEICPSTLAKFFSDSGYNVKQCTPTFNSHSVNAQIPKLDLISDDTFNTLDFVEWLGMISLNCNLEPDPTNYLSSYMAPEIEIGDFKNVTCFRLQGLFSTQTMVEYIEKITKLLDESTEKWIAIYVQGFSDCPVAWGNEEHHYYVNGDNGYILLFNKNEGLICTHKCSRQRYK